MEMNINNILVKMLLRENRKVVLTENSLDKAIDKARKQVLSPIYIDLFSQIEDKEELLRDINSPYIPHLTAQKYIETIDSTTVGEAETHINEWVYSVVKAIDITFGVDMTLVKKDPARQPLILAMNNMLIRTLAEGKIDLYVPEANKIAMFMNNLKVDKIDENMMNDISSMDMGQFMDKYASDIMANQKETEAKHQNIQYSGNGYTCVKISSFEEASKYAPYCKWCISHTKAQWDKHTNYNGGLFYFFLKDGYQNIPEQHGKDFPYDEYGLSMIALCVNEFGLFQSKTLRWNHDCSVGEFAFDNKDMCDTVGMNIYQVCRPRVEGLADKVYDISNAKNIGNGLYVVKEESNKVLVNRYGKIVLPMWMDKIGDFVGNYAEVVKDFKYNFINTRGQLVSQEWFDRMNDFIDGYARVKQNNKYNFIDTNYRLISKEWFDYADNYSDGYALVEMDGIFNYLDRRGRYVTDDWFDDALPFKEGFAVISNDDQYNLIDNKFNVICDTWFDGATSFSDGLARVTKGGKFNFVRPNGHLFSNVWFDNADDFSDKYTSVSINGNTYYMDTEGYLYDMEGKEIAGKRIQANEERYKTKNCLNEKYIHKSIIDELKIMGILY